MDNHYDLIVIGSGIGGLTVASLYSQAKKKKVLVLERHFKLGGFTHTFRREGIYEWDVGVHYIGEMQKGSSLRVLMDAVTGKKVEFNPMPDIFERFIYPSFQFYEVKGEENYKKALLERYPNEKDSIERYFKDVKDAANWFGSYGISKSSPEFLKKIIEIINFFGKDPSKFTTQEYLDAHFKNPELKTILCSQWGDYGLPPSQSCFAIHSLIVNHYLNGGYYPNGTARKIAESVKEIVESYGGKLQINTKVSEIIIQNNKAIGVKAVVKRGGKEEEKEYFAPIIVSNAGAYTTYLKLVPQSYPIPFREELETMKTNTTCVIGFLGFHSNPKTYGFNGENYWIYAYDNHEEVFQKRNEIIHGNPSMVYLSFPSLKDSQTNGHTAELISLVDYSLFKKWEGTEWKKRGEDYLELKDKILNGLISLVEKYIPGFSKNISYKELSTPLTNEEFTGHPHGAIYGLPCNIHRYSKSWLGAKTPIDNLFLTGADVLSPGIGGAMAGGLSCLAHILGPLGIGKIFAKTNSN